MAALVLFVIVLLLLLLGFPVAFTLGGTSVLFALVTDPSVLLFMPMRVWGILENYVLIAVPLFVFMGVTLERSGLAEDLLDTMALVFGRLPGGLAVSVVAVGALLAASTGIVGATVVTMGLLSLPTMLRRGYSPELACGTIAASGTLGQIIPPSIVLILLGSVLQVSVGDMFLGAALPGFLLVGLYGIWVVGYALWKPAAAPAVSAAERAAFTGGVMWRRLAGALLPPLVLMVAVLGSIFAGVASPTEAAAVGALGALILTGLHRRLSVKTVREVCGETAHLTCMVFMILVGATVFGLVFRGLGGDEAIVHLVEKAALSKGEFLLVVMLAVFIAGFFIDFIEITFIIVPVVAPIFVRMEVDLLWVGILIAINLQTSFLTPPFGFSLFYLKGVAPPEIKTAHLYRGIVPFIVIQLIGVGLVVAFPKLATWLPEAVSAWQQASRGGGP